MYNIRRGGAIASQHEKLQNSHEQAVSAASKDVDHCADIGNELGLGAGHRTPCSTQWRTSSRDINATEKNVQCRYPSVHYGNRAQNM